MTNKPLWAASAVIIIVAAAIGAWKILATQQAVTPPTGPAIVTVGSSNVVFTGTIPTYSGIENIYLMSTGGYNKDDDLGSNTTGRLGVIESSGSSAEIPYETAFDIVIAFKVKAPENAAYAAKENARIELTASGAFTIGPENSDDGDEYVFASQNPGTNNGWVRVNAVWDNNNNGYKLPAGGTLSLSSVKLFCWW